MFLVQRAIRRPGGQSDLGRPFVVGSWRKDARGCFKYSTTDFFTTMRKVGQNSAYPHYEPTIRPAFHREWERFVFEAPALDGRIEVDLSHAVRNSDMKEVFQLNVSAKGRPVDTSVETLMQWMDRGREHVVKGFVELTTPEAHKIWKRIA